MDDISPELLQKLQNNFNERVSADSEITQLEEKIRNGNATYRDAERYSVRVGEALSGAFGEEISSDILPDGHMYYNIGQKTVLPMLREDYRMVSGAAADTQRALNTAAGLHLQVQKPEFNEDRAHGLIDRLDNTEKYDDAAWLLKEPVVNFSQSIVDETIEANADFHAKVGLNPKIVREAEPKCCEWCRDLAGTYEYPTGREVYARHENCQCAIEYFPGDGTKIRQTNWKHNTWEERKERIQERIRQTGGRETGGHNYSRSREDTKNDIIAGEKYREYTRVDDSEQISRNTGFSADEIREVRRHIFFDKHKLESGYERLAPDYYMAVAWKRLQNGDFLQRDITLLRHELLESRIEKEYNLTNREAHKIASETYNWVEQLMAETNGKGEADGLL